MKIRIAADEPRVITGFCLSCLSDHTVTVRGPFMPVCPVCRVGMPEGEDAEEARADARAELAGEMVRENLYQ